MNISVIIPLYNKAPYIRRAIDSVLRQNTLPAEILVIDDGSTDTSAQVVKDISDSRLRLIQQPNAGECAARNRGIIEARYELVAFLDADDEWKPDFLTHIQRLIVDFPGCGIFATAFDVLQPSGELYSPKLTGIPPEPWSGILLRYFKITQSVMPFFPSSVAASRQFCLEVGGFPEGVKRGGDILMWVRMGIRYSIAYSTSRQAIYHTDAINRACDVFIVNEESACAREISSMLDGDKVPVNLVEDLREYRDLLNIRKAKEILFSGNSVGARELLNKAHTTRLHRWERFWWLFWSWELPSLILPFVRRAYAGFR